MTREHYDSQLHELDTEILAMGELVAETIAASVNALQVIDVEAAKRLIEADTRIDDARYNIENQALLIIATQQPLARDLRTIAAILTIATELERIGDYCEGIAKLTLRMAGEPVVVALTAIQSMSEITQRLVREVIDAYRDRDLNRAGSVWTRDDEVDDLYEQVFRGILVGMVADPSTVRRGTYLLWVAHNLERIADRVTNIAERIAFIVTGDVESFRSTLEARTIPS